MKKFLTILLLLVSSLARVCGATVSDADCRRMLRQIEDTYDRYPDSIVVIRTAERFFPLLRRNSNLYYYISACNTYIDWLFRHGELDKTKRELERVVEVATMSSQPEVVAIARRAQGQYLLRLGLHGRAMEFFRSALDNAGDYRRLQDPFTYSSIVMQMVSVRLQEHKPEPADRLVRRLDAFVAWTDSAGIADRRMWIHNRVAAFHASIELQRGNKELARQWLAASRSYMQPGVPRRRYITYYIALRDLFEAERRYDESLAVVDTLIAYGYDLLPMRVRFLKDRAVTLHRLGRGLEAADAYERYISETDVSDRLSTAAELDILRDKFAYEKTVADKRRAEAEAVVAAVASLVLLVLAAVLVWLTLRLRQKNRHLVRLVMQADRDAGARDTKPSANDDDSTVLLGRAAIDYMRSSECYIGIDGGRGALATRFHVSERAIVAAVSLAAGCSFKYFSNGLKLERSRRLLESDYGLPIAAIAAECGFGTVRTYQSLFKDRYGLSPSEYRASVRNWPKRGADEE